MRACCWLAQPAVSTEMPFFAGPTIRTVGSQPEWIHGFILHQVQMSAFLLIALIGVYGHIQYFLVLSQSLCTDQSSGDVTIFKHTCSCFVIGRED